MRAASKPPEPIRSAREDDPGLLDAIERFVVELGARIDALQDLEQSLDLGELALGARVLADEADSLGYPLLAHAAQSVSLCCSDRDSDGAHERLVELTRIVQRVRRGHRSAA